MYNDIFLIDGSFMKSSCKCCSSKDVSALIERLKSVEDCCEMCVKLIKIINDTPEVKLELEKYVKSISDTKFL